MPAVASLLAFLAAMATFSNPTRGIHRLIATPRRNALGDSVIERRKVLSIGAPDLARTAGRRLAVIAGLVAIGILVAATAGPSIIISAVAIAAVLALILTQRSRQAGQRAATSRRAAVIEACDILSADLTAGRPPADALEAAATICPDLQVASAAAKLGGDVPAALELAAESPGSEGLRALSAAWRVAEESGAAFALITERLADSLRADEAIRRQITANLAGTRATARLLAALPLFGTALGYAIGAHPLTFLLTTPLGYLCLLTGLLLTALGLHWTTTLTTKATP